MELVVSRSKRCSLSLHTTQILYTVAAVYAANCVSGLLNKYFNGGYIRIWNHETQLAAYVDRLVVIKQVVQFIVTVWTSLFTYSMRIFKEFTSVRFCTHFHTFGELLDPSNVLDVNHFVIRFDKVLHCTVGCYECLYPFIRST